jgi:hypothetical protein
MRTTMGSPGTSSKRRSPCQIGRRRRWLPPSHVEAGSSSRVAARIVTIADDGDDDDDDDNENVPLRFQRRGKATPPPSESAVTSPPLHQAPALRLEVPGLKRAFKAPESSSGGKKRMKLCSIPVNSK